MSAELGPWLREQREAQGWTKREMARRIIKAGRTAGDKSMPGIDGVYHNIHRWESGKGGVTERYKLYYCKAFGIPAAQFGGATAHPPATVGGLAMVTPAGAAAAGVTAQVPVAVTNQLDPSLPVSSTFAYGGIQESVMGDCAIQREVLMAAHEGSEHAEDAEQRGIGDATLEPGHALPGFRAAGAL